MKTREGRTITAEISPEQTTEIVKRKIEAKTGIQTDDHQLVARGKVIMDNTPLKEYGLSGGETIEMTAKLLGGTKHKSLSPKPMDTERDKKRNESEPYIDVGGLEDENLQANLDEEIADTKKWMSEAIRDLKERSDDMSDLERLRTSVNWDMNEVKGNLTKVTESLMKISEGNEARDRKLDDFIKSLSTGLNERDKRTDERIQRMVMHIDAKMDERLADLDTRISAIERNTMSVGHRSLCDAQARWGPTPTNRKAVLHGFKSESKEQDVKAIVIESIKATGMKEEHTLNYPAIPITHVFVEFEDTRTRDRCVRSANMRKYELDGRRIKISPALEPDERFGKKRLGYIKYVINKKTGIERYWKRLNLQKKRFFRSMDRS